MYDQSYSGIDHVCLGRPSRAHVARQHAKRQRIDALHDATTRSGHVDGHRGDWKVAATAWSRVL
jgi:hypothetical protein